MSELERDVEVLIAAVEADDGTYDEAMEAAGALLQTSQSAPIDALNESIEKLAPSISGPHLDRSGIAAIVCGTLVERGGDPELAIEELATTLRSVLPAAHRFAQRCHDRFLEEFGHPDACCPPDEREELRPDQYMTPDVQAMVAEDHPDEEAAWVAVDLVCRPAVAMLSRAPDARRSLAEDEALVEAAYTVAEVHSSAYFVFALLRVLDDEELLVIAPEEKRGFRVRISGVADNFQLHTLLAGELVGEGRLDGEALDPKLVAVARGEGPPTIDGEIVEGPWTLFEWTAIGEDGAIPDGFYNRGTTHWIWNEGVPADIAAFEGTRVVLLGAAPYIRTWSASRIFEALPVEFEVIEDLPTEAVTEWLTRFRDAQYAEEESATDD